MFQKYYQDIITIDPAKRGGRPCIRGMRITVYDVLGYLAAGMSTEEILDDFPYLTKEDIGACLAYASERESVLYSSRLPKERSFQKSFLSENAHSHEADF